jgi:hypothetical protein
VAYAEIAQMLGVSRKRAHEILRKPDFPDPIATLSVGRIWAYDDVARFCESTGRQIHELTSTVQ